MRPLTYPLPGLAAPISRRSFLAGSASFALAALVSGCAGPSPARRGFSGYPFALGVASGDPTPDGVVLWTRLAPQPLEPGGGMSPEPVEVSWQVAEDEGMSRVVRRGTAVANPAWAHSVHVEVEGLQPARWYWYQFKAGSEVSAKGRTRTMPAAAVTPERLRFAFVSCQKYEMGYFTAYEHLAREDLDLICHLGDYIYEREDDRNAVRRHNTPEVFTVDDYRARYAVYKLDPVLQAVHTMAPWMVTWDDHEVANNYAAAIPENPAAITSADFLRRRAAAYQAYYEHMPLRRTTLPSGPDMLLYRRLGFGQLVTFNVLDTRQYRTDQPQGDGTKPASPVLMDPKGTILGDRQRQWLFDGLAGSKAAWNVMAQQVPVARIDAVPGPDVGHSMDKWSAYEFERRRFLKHLHDARVANPVVITGDVHHNSANELIADFDQLDSRSVATEFVGTSIASGGDGEDQPARVKTLMAENPFVKFQNYQRGYVRCEVTAKAWRTDYRTVPFITKPNAPITTRASFVVESGRPTLNQA